MSDDEENMLYLESLGINSGEQHRVEWYVPNKLRTTLDSFLRATTKAGQTSHVQIGEDETSIAII